MRFEQRKQNFRASLTGLGWERAGRVLRCWRGLGGILKAERQQDEGGKQVDGYEEFRWWEGGRHILIALGCRVFDILR
jgi:hypothetical protein